MKKGHIRSFPAFFDLYYYDLFIHSDLFSKTSFRLDSQHDILSFVCYSISICYMSNKRLLDLCLGTISDTCF